MGEAALGSCCDRLERTALQKRRAGRGTKGALGRLMGKGLPMGVRDGAAFVAPAVGSAQGAGLSPWLGHVYGPYGCDRW